MLRIMNFEELQGVLLRVPALINNLERRTPGFAVSVKEWLVEAERVLLNNRLAVAAEIAALRGTLISAERGTIPAGMVFSKRTTLQKIKDAAAADVLRKAEELLSNAVRADAARFAEGERLMQQIITVAQRKGLITANASVNDHTQRLKAIWNALNMDPDLAGVTLHLTGLVGPHDAMILLDRKLPNAETN